MSTPLARLLRPQHLAVVGGGNWCTAVIEQCRKFGFKGDIWPVHPTKSEIAGLKTFAHIDQLPQGPDASFIGVNRFLTCDIVADLHRRNAGGAVCFASGFEETSDPQAAGLQQSLLQRAGSLAVLGPNCYGLINAFDRFVLWPDQHGCIPVERGVAILTQSSNIAINISMQHRGLPLGYLLTTGNQAQQNFASIGQSVLEDERVTAIGLHIEGIGDVPAFERLVAKAHALGKPIVALKVGKSTLAQQATQSHTASLAGTSAGATALLERLGVYQANSLIEFIDQLKTVHLLGHTVGRRLASLSCSGGEASLVADAIDAVNQTMPASTVADAGLCFPALSETTKSRLADQLGPIPALANPLDYHTDIWRNYEAMKNVFSAMAGPEIDVTMLILDFPRADRCSAEDWDITVKAVIDAAAETKKAFAVVASLPENLPESVCQHLMDHGVLTFHGIDEAVKAIAAVAKPLPIESEAALQGTSVTDGTTLSEAAAKALLQQSGVSVPRHARVTDEKGLVAAAADMRYPLVLKGEGFAHKSESGAVQLNINNISGLLDAYRAISSDAYLVEEQVAAGVVELLVGVTHDPAHGYLLILGAGGVQTELTRDTQSLLIPASKQSVENALQRLNIAPLLAGYRGKPGIDWPQLFNTIDCVQQFVIQHAGKLSEFEINPLICTPDRVVAVDALIVGCIET